MPFAGPIASIELTADKKLTAPTQQISIAPKGTCLLFQARRIASLWSVERRNDVSRNMAFAFFLKDQPFQTRAA
jgi:hypothetical protein